MTSRRRSRWAILLTGLGTLLWLGILVLGPDRQVRPDAPEPIAHPTAADPAREAPPPPDRVLVAERQESTQADRRTGRRSFTDEEWGVATKLLAKPSTSLVQCEVLSSDGTYLSVRCLEAAPGIAVTEGGVAWVWDNTEDVRRQHPELSKRGQLRVGDRRHMVIRKVWWRRHLLMTGA